MTKKKLFKVEKLCIPEWGKTTTEYVKYFSASEESTVKAVVKERFERAGWYNYDRCEIRYEITELEFEEL